MRVVCAWCLDEISDDKKGGPTSHGICERCKREQFDVTDKPADSLLPDEEKICGECGGLQHSGSCYDDDESDTRDDEDYGRVMQVEFDAGKL